MPSSQIEGRGAHPLLSSEFRPVSVGDSAWMELTRFFQLDPAWVQDKLQRGLLFWQTMKGKTEPERVTLVSEAVARLWAARPSDGRKVAWARLGVFLFEQLPKGLMNGLAPCRWRLHAEGIYHLSSILRSRRITLTSELLRHLLCADHRQSILTEGTPLANAVASGAGGAETAYHHVCGGVIVGLGDSWLAGVVTPKQLRILADDDVAQALLEELPQPVRQLPPLPRLSIPVGNASADVIMASVSAHTEIAQTVAAMPQAHLQLCLGTMQELAKASPERARATLLEHPQLCYALLHAQFLLGLSLEPALPPDAMETQQLRAEAVQRAMANTKAMGRRGPPVNRGGPPQVGMPRPPGGPSFMPPPPLAMPGGFARPPGGCGWQVKMDTS
ncbi:unnamed protein product [Effrenium voratum]|nr:unnamed protein product [Effrenium voratum]